MAYSWVLHFNPLCQSLSLTHVFRPFTINQNIDLSLPFLRFLCFHFSVFFLLSYCRLPQHFFLLHFDLTMFLSVSFKQYSFLEVVLYIDIHTQIYILYFICVCIYMYTFSLLVSFSLSKIQKSYLPLSLPIYNIIVIIFFLHILRTIK